MVIEVNWVISVISYMKKEEGRRKKEEGRRKKEEGTGKKEG
ncbi:hypothetical protein [Okeania sp. KiyG1]|nr:hypothetical protein [Okeania sp. KiyG1]